MDASGPGGRLGGMGGSITPATVTCAAVLHRGWLMPVVRDRLRIR